MFNTTKALVLRQVRYKEADRILTLLTQSDGKLTAKARGALRKGSRLTAATQQLCYAEMTLFGNRGKWTVNEASVIEAFPGLQTDIEKLALGCYFAECLEALSPEEAAEPALLQLGLNSLYALSRDLYPASLIKAAFELRLMALSGYAPEVSACAVCGRTEPEEPCLSQDSGRLCCRRCRTAELGTLLPLDGAALAALRYILTAAPKQLFSFSLSEPSLSLLARAAERYLPAHAERHFSTLDYWKGLQRQPENGTPEDGPAMEEEP